MEEKTLHKHLVAKTDGKAEPDNILIAGSIRITVIFPNLIRAECGSEKSFCDEATQSVWFRNHGKVDFTYEITKTKIIIKTEKAEFCINRRNGTAIYAKIGDMESSCDNSENLKGTARTLDRHTVRFRSKTELSRVTELPYLMTASRCLCVKTEKSDRASRKNAIFMCLHTAPII